MVTVRIRRLLLWVALPALVLLLLYTVLGFVVVPRLIRSGVSDFVTRSYHRTVAIGDIRFNPYSLRLDIRDFSLPDSDGQPMVSFSHLLVDLTVASIWRRGPDFESILLEQPFARVLIKPDGSLNFSELALPPSPEAKPEPNAKPPRLFIGHFSVAGGNVAFEDRAHPSEFRTEIKPINFDLRDFATVGKEDGAYSLTGASEAGETFSWSGSLSAIPLASHGKFEVGNLKAQTIWNYLRDSVQFELPSGTISLSGDYDFTAATTPAGVNVNVHQLTVSDLGIRPKGATDDYVKLARLEIHETRADVAKHTVDVGNIHLAGAEFRAWMPGKNGAAVNLMELAGPTGSSTASGTVPSASAAGSPAAPSGATAAGADASAAPSPAWIVSVPDIALDGIKIAAEDRKVSPAVPVRLDDLNIHVTGFTTAHTTPVAVTMSTKINGGGRLEAKADLSPDFAALKGAAELANLDLTVLQPYIARQTAMTLRSGLLSTKLNIERGADGQVAVTGETDVAKFRTVDNELQRDFIKFDRLQIGGIEFKANLSDAAQPGSLRVHNITARGPYARVIIESDRTINVKRVLSGPQGLPPAANQAAAPEPVAMQSATTTPEATQAAAATPPAAPPAAHGSKRKVKKGAPPDAAPAPSNDGSMKILVDAINIVDGSANYADLWILPHFAVGIQTLNGSILGLSSDPRAHAKVELNGKVDRYAPVRIWGETNPFSATAFTDIKMMFKGVELTSVSPYSGHFAGYKIEKGKLSVDIEYKIENRQLNAAHKVTIDQLELGERVESPDAVHLPLKIAIALLKDRNGVIDLDLPVTGSLDDPQFKLGPLIWKVVVNVLTKVATAPFALLGHLFGGGEQMNFIDFHPGSAVLDASEHDKLVALVKALKEKEKLELDVPVTFSADLDRPALAAAHLNQRLLALSQEKAGGHKTGKSAAATRGAASAGAASGATVPAAVASEAAASGAGAPAAVGAQAAAAAGAPAPGGGSSNDSNSPRVLEVMDLAPPTDPALTDPAQRFHLLVALHRAEFGKSTPLPESVKATEDAEKKKDQQPDFAAANAELEAALLQKAPVPDSELETLGKHRAHAIQDALLVGTDIDPARVFVIGTAPKSEAEKDKVRVELALK